MRRALEIDEQSYGKDHPEVAIALHNLAGLFYSTNRFVKSEQLMCRALEIFLKFTRVTGHKHPHLQDSVNNYSVILQAMGRSQKEIIAILHKMGTEIV